VPLTRPVTCPPGKSTVPRKLPIATGAPATVATASGVIELTPSAWHQADGAVHPGAGAADGRDERRAGAGHARGPNVAVGALAQAVHVTLPTTSPSAIACGATEASPAVLNPSAAVNRSAPSVRVAVISHGPPLVNVASSIIRGDTIQRTSSCAPPAVALWP
jgi:hypothetical protein